MNIGPGREEDLTDAHAALSIDIGVWRDYYGGIVYVLPHIYTLEYTLLRNLHRELFSWVYLSDLSTLSDTTPERRSKRWQKIKITKEEQKKQIKELQKKFSQSWKNSRSKKYWNPYNFMLRLFCREIYFITFLLL